jgi:hypothetical protein
MDIGRRDVESLQSEMFGELEARPGRKWTMLGAKDFVFVVGPAIMQSCAQSILLTLGNLRGDMALSI